MQGIAHVTGAMTGPCLSLRFEAICSYALQHRLGTLEVEWRLGKDMVFL